MAIFRKKAKFRSIKNNSTPLVPNSGGFYDSSIGGKTYDKYFDSIENRAVAGIRIQNQTGPRLVKKR